MRDSKPADVMRSFWALFLGSEVAKDGQVKGWRAWWEANPQHRDLAAAFEADSVRQVCQHGRSLAESLPEVVTDFKRSLAKANRERVNLPEGFALVDTKPLVAQVVANLPETLRP